MKYLFLSLLFSALFLKFGYAQKFEGGIVLGLVGSQVAGDQYSGYKKAGLNAGGWINLPIGEKSKLQMELTYIQKGSRENPDYEKNKLDSYLMRLGYVQLPLVYLYQYNNLIGFEAGLGMNFLIHSNEKFNGYETIESPFSNTNLCFLAGISFRVTDLIRISLRTDNSLFSIRKNKVSGDVWRFWGHGQFSDALVLSAYYKL
jgi:hypothetical protein